MEKVTVIITTYNEKTGVFKEAVDSILNQTFEDYKLLIVIDNPDNKDIINYLKKIEKNKKIEILINDCNIGVPRSMNKAIDMVKSKYIAKMDADDISLPNRLQIQYDYMENNRDIDLISSGVTYMSYDGKDLYDRGMLPTGYKHVAKALSYVNLLHHPTFFGKTEMFKNVKYRNLRYAQDYDFSCRACEKNYNVDLINDVVLKYRLPFNNQENKKVRQCITAYYIRKFYKKGELCKKDIVNIVEKEVEKSNCNRIMSAIIHHEKALDLRQQKKYISCIYNMLKSVTLSKYHRRMVVDMINYFFIKCFWRITK